MISPAPRDAHLTIIDPAPELSDGDYADWLLSGEAVRTQSKKLFDLGLQNKLLHFSLNPEKLDDAADYVIEVISQNYPDFRVPPHSRWRHFVFDGVDRWDHIAKSASLSSDEQARVECELAILSVLLDAGAGARWSYRDRLTGLSFCRSEGLALASLDLYCAGAFSTDEENPFKADIEGLRSFSVETLKDGFQVDENNTLEGLEGRARLIKALADCLHHLPDVFPDGRLGGVADYLKSYVTDGKLSADIILKTVLHALGRIWQGRPMLGGRNLGDTWVHPHLEAPSLVPFHKLSQWLSYSLYEPMERSGLQITDQSTMTGLAEYRNGGLFLDLGVIQLKDPAMSAIEHSPSDTLIVEWRALTVMLLDEIAIRVREKLGKSDEDLPLASVLEGGTWAAGRKIAKTLREGGPPPLMIKSDGSVF